MLKKLHYISFCFFLVLTSYGYAQEQQIAYFESDFILSRIPEYAGIEQQLDDLARSWRTEIDKMDLELEALEQDLEAKEILFTDEIKRQKRDEIIAKKNQRDAYLAQKFGPEGEYFLQQQELLEPLQRQVFTAVRAVAQRKGIDFVFDRSGDIYMVYARSEWNINEDVLLELGLEIE